MDKAIVKVSDFKKRYGNYLAVDSISFEVYPGEIFGLLGPNGAGKTTTLECLEGLRTPDGGSLEIMGINPARDSKKLRNILGVQLQASGLPASISVEEAMRLFSNYHGLSPRYDLLHRLGLEEKMKTQYHMLSVGQQRRLVLALAIAHNPKVVILDEPTAGLDVASRVELHEIMNELRKAGTTIILATHDMAEAEKMVDRVAILLKGRIASTGTPKEITATGSGLTKISVRTSDSSLLKVNHNFAAVTQQNIKDEYIIYYSIDPGPTVSDIISYVKENGDSLIDLRVERPSLEERFLEITNAGGAAV